MTLVAAKLFALDALKKMPDHHGDMGEFPHDPQYDIEMPKDACCGVCSHADDDCLSNELFCFCKEKYVEKDEQCDSWEE